jgi:hypothetical protein
MTYFSIFSLMRLGSDQIVLAQSATSVGRSGMESSSDVGTVPRRCIQSVDGLWDIGLLSRCFLS